MSEIGSASIIRAGVRLIQRMSVTMKSLVSVSIRTGLTSLLSVASTGNHAAMLA
jgi:hypothetical protein